MHHSQLLSRGGGSQGEPPQKKMTELNRMFGSPAMQLRETREKFAKGCFVQYHLPEHARSDHIVKPDCLVWISGSVQAISL